MDVIKSDPGLIQENPEPIVYRCRKCRRIVASKSNLLLHKVQFNQTMNNKTLEKSDDNNKTTESNDKDKDDEAVKKSNAAALVEQIAQQIQENCAINRGSGQERNEGDVIYCDRMIFVEPMSWMKDVLTQTNGKLNCPKCGNKIGHFNWTGSEY